MRTPPRTMVLIYLRRKKLVVGGAPPGRPACNAEKECDVSKGDGEGRAGVMLRTVWPKCRGLAWR